MPVETLLHLGGVATRRQLVDATSRPRFEAALGAGEIIRIGRGRYALPSVDEARAAAHRISGVLCLTSAALDHGWAVKLPPDLPQVCLPRGRKPPADAATVQLHWLRLGPDDVRDGVTTRSRTLADCLRMLPLDEALAIADSALRTDFPRAQLLALARDARGPDSARMRLVAQRATPQAANPFESVTRAICDSVAGLRVKPQVTLHRVDPEVVGGTFLGRPDLVDEHLRIVIEADSFEWHGDRAALRDDARRYDSFVVDGWLVLRFAWEDVMFDADWVRSILIAAVEERTNQLCPACRRAS